MKLKRFLLFEGYGYEHHDGWHAFVNSFDTAAETFAARSSDENVWAQVVDCETGEEIEQVQSIA